MVWAGAFTHEGVGTTLRHPEAAQEESGACPQSSGVQWSMALIEQRWETPSAARFTSDGYKSRSDEGRRVVLNGTYGGTGGVFLISSPCH
jgi:hypothetical protein